MTFKLGLTGSIGMGKSTTAQMFVDEGCVLWDADAAVHRLYAKGGAAVEPISKRFPGAIADNAVSRERLKAMIANDPAILGRIEQIVHPLVAEDRRAFLNDTTADIAVLDIPLLFETGGDLYVDAVACVTVSPEIQRKRVLERANMTAAQFEAIMAKQMPDAEKRKRSDYIIETDTLEHAREQVKSVVNDIRGGLNHA
ncbi:Dephospho-CoA kinase [Roseovarius litorisediminis]|uniref:Dephospho-CoA kinase n=1 Tax=Roseovarius litorisediminis TaxID=1312363 RepID=A0A1Y5SLL0_9RHOB|nr:dephospho-CoA kinase [Roseovarius litorisediminis]SLN43585.1 Dephospho-CoA kinase [Roseovarius litorisediminis]